MRDFACWINPDFSITGGNKLRPAIECRSEYDLVLYLRRNAELVHHLRHVITTRRLSWRGMHNRAGGQHRCPELLFARNVWLFGPILDDYAYADGPEGPASLALRFAFFLQSVQRGHRHDEDVGLFAGRYFLAQSGNHRVTQFDLMPGLSFELWHENRKNFFRCTAAHDVDLRCNPRPGKQQADH